MEDSVEKWFKEKANNLNVIPPHEAWKTIEDALEDPVGKWYQEESKDLNVIPTHQTWSSIENSLEDWPRFWYQSNAVGLEKGTPDLGWESIAKQLEIQRNQRKGYRNFILRTTGIFTLLILIPLFLANVAPTYRGVTVFPKTLTNEQPPNVDRSSTDITQRTTTDQNATLTVSKTVLFEPNTNAAQPTQSVLSTTPEATTSFEGFDFSEQLKTRTVSPLPVFTSDERLPLSLSSRPPENSKTKNTRNSKWSIGATSFVGSSSLINPLSFREDVVVGNTFNFAFGLTASRKLRKNVISADLIFNDVKSQSALLSSENLNTQLNGITLGLQYERWLPSSSANRWMPDFYFGSGVFGSYLQNAKITSNLTDSYFGQFRYKHIDFGVVFTAGATIHLNNRISFSAAARVQSGAINLFDGIDKVPSDFFRTQSRSIGLQTRISYTL